MVLNEVTDNTQCRCRVLLCSSGVLWGCFGSLVLPGPFLLLMLFDQDAVAFVYDLEVAGALQRQHQHVEVVIGHDAI